MKRYPDYPLGVLAACRQIHQEAALVPFTDNTFRFGTWSVLSLRYLLPQQAHAIRSAVYNDSYTMQWANDKDATFAESKLPGLKRLIVFRSFSEYDCKYIDSHLKRMNDQTRAQEALLAFESLPIETAVVALPVCRWHKDIQTDDHPALPPEMMDQWATGLERCLKVPHNGITWEQRYPVPRHAR